VDAARTAGLIATAFVLLGLFFSLLLPRSKPREIASEAGEVAAEPPTS
jgi:hypothetical protein